MYDPRNYVDESNGNLQNTIPRGFRGAVYPAEYPNEDVLLGYGQALALRVSPFFGSQDQGGERTPPEVRVDTSGAVEPVDGLLEISFTASDDTGLAGALLLANGSHIEELPLSGRQASAVFATPWYGPGDTDQYQVVVYDVYGNRSLAATDITPATGFNAAPHPHIQVLGNSTPRINQPLTLDARYSGDVSSPTLTVEWDLDGDGVFDTAPTQFKTLVTSYHKVGTHWFAPA